MINIRRKTHEEFVEEVGRLNETVEILSEYYNWSSRIKCKCKTCGNEWETSPASLLQGCGCKKCGHINVGLAKSISCDEFVEKMKVKCPTVEALEPYKGSHIHIKFKCLVCKNVWEAEPTKIINGHTGCPNCGNYNRGRSNALSQEEFIERVRKNSPNIEVIGEYKNNCEPIKMRCITHNEIFYGNPRCVLYKGGNVCPKCNDSTGEKELHKILDEYNINYAVQHTIDDCVYVGKLKFDAFDLTRCVGYEYQGEQHYKPVNFGNIDDHTANENLKLTQSRDNAKRQYCEKHGIPLVEIPYWEKDNMRDFLIKKWNELNLNIA